ncbi:DNA-binding transcriptional LysR family regulator [Bradyrhizobium sp. USDA 4518]
MHNFHRRRPSLQASKAIELKHLRSAVAAADCGSFRQAAELLGSQQSSLSRRIGEIEHHLGVAIFERYSGGVRPTRSGRCILRLARTIVEEFDALVSTAKSVQNSESGRLSVGFFTSLSAGNLQNFLLEFKQRYPQIELATIERSRTRLAAALRSGVTDMLIVPGRPPLLDAKALPLWSERVLVALPQDHILSSRETVNWIDLRKETVLLSYYDPGAEFEDLLVAKLASPGDRPKIERHDVSRGIINSLISMRAGISLALESDIVANLAGVTYRELRDNTGCSLLDFWVYWRAENENPTLAVFLQLVSERSPRAGSDVDALSLPKHSWPQR